MSNATDMYVRLKPYNKKRGHVVRRYHVAGQLFVAQDTMGNPRWYRVSKKVADYLGRQHQNHRDPDSPDLFDVCTPAEYERIAHRERDMRLVEMGLASQRALEQGQVVQERVTDLNSGRAAALVDYDARDAEQPPEMEVSEVGGEEDGEDAPVEQPPEMSVEQPPLVEQPPKMGADDSDDDGDAGDDDASPTRRRRRSGS